MPDLDPERKVQADSLYERYGKPLEREHLGDYLAVSLDGKTLIGSSLLDVANNAATTLGPGNFIFKIGERAVGRWR